MLPFCCHKGYQSGKKPLFIGFFKGVKSFPLHCSRGFRGDVVDDAVDVFHFVGDAVGNLSEQIVGNLRPVRRHKVVGGHSAQGDEMVVGSVVAHHADGFHVRQDGEELT